MVSEPARNLRRLEETVIVYRFILEGVSRYNIYTKLMKYRSRLEIIASMLQVASRGDASRTTIMYKSFISHAQLKEFLSFLLQKGLVLEYHKDEAKAHRGEKKPCNIELRRKDSICCASTTK